MVSERTEAATVYQGRFGTYTITRADRRGVLAYRLALLVVALAFAAGAGAAVAGASAWVVTACYAVFCAALGVALATIHIYMLALHRALWIFWGIGVAASLALAWLRPVPLALSAYSDPLSLVGTGFVFVALTGICIKESFCFGWWETAVAAVALPVLLLGHLFGVLGGGVEIALLAAVALSLVSVSVRKFSSPAPDDIGDKSIHAYVRGEIAG